MTGLRSWFDGRSLREKRLLVVMVALAVVTIVWGGVIRPVRDGLSSTRERYDDAVVRLGEAQASVAAIRSATRSRSLEAPVADTVRTRADQAGFTIESLTEEAPGRVRLRIPSARPAALTPWLAALENAGVLIEQATLTDNGDRTVAAVLVVRARAA